SFLDTVIQRQPSDPNTFHAGRAKPIGKVRVAKSRIAFDVRTGCFTDNNRIVRKFEIGMKFSAARTFHTMDRPNPAPMFEADVIRRMPVAGGEDRNVQPLGFGNPFVKFGNDLVTVRNRKSPPGAEIPLYVGNE